MTKERCIKVHVTAEEYQICAAKALKAGVSLSGYMRNAGLNDQSGPVQDQLLRDVCTREKILAALQELARNIAKSPLSASDVTTLLAILIDLENGLKEMRRERRTR
jgi:hypothetical protein